MILGIGTDIVTIERVEKLITKFGDNFLKKVFTANEIAQADFKNNQDVYFAFYAKRFAAKEAFAKAIGLGIGRGIDFCDIEITNDNLGKPQLKLINEKDKLLQKHFQTEKFSINLSLSDEAKIALAFVVISA